MLKYIGLLLILFIILFIYCHVTNLTVQNNHLDIIQVNDPEPELILELLDNYQPIIMQKELYFWKELNKLLGKSLTEIKENISSNPELNYTESIKNNLEPLNLPLSYDWNIDIRNVIINDKSGIFFIKQNNFRQCFGCITGEFRIIISPPDQSKYCEPFINSVSTINVTELLDKNPQEMNFIEIIIRKGNLVYIPYGWLYFIYSSNLSNECVMVDCLNKSILSNFIIY